MKHQNITKDQRHPIHAFEYPNQATREGASLLTASDLYRVALQLDDHSYWVLVDIDELYGTPTWVAFASSGGRTLIEELTPSGVATVSFNSISQIFNVLTLEFAIRGSASATNVSAEVLFNNDSTDGNYITLVHQIYGTTPDHGVAKSNNNSVFYDQVCAANAPSGAFTTGIATIPNYAKTNMHKSLFMHLHHLRDLSSVFLVEQRGELYWKDTDAIESILIGLSSGNFDTGSVLRLYGEV